mgnify:CR=1 FL=1|tara:strand:+ start:300 stop:629 length:330 start_codon:yes stop_codon:yes gene_type:complete
MNTLSKELTDLFVDDEKNSEMMNDDCYYRSYYSMAGYGKELTNMVVAFKEMDSYGGEDCGSEYWCVWEFTRGDEVARFKFEGWYASYDGATFEQVFEVNPVQKTITVWE